MTALCQEVRIAICTRVSGHNIWGIRHILVVEHGLVFKPRIQPMVRRRGIGPMVDVVIHRDWLSDFLNHNQKLKEAQVLFELKGGGG